MPITQGWSLRWPERDGGEDFIQLEGDGFERTGAENGWGTLLLYSGVFSLIMAAEKTITIGMDPGTLKRID